MLKLTSIFLSLHLLFAGLLPSMHMDDLVKIPALIQHYNKHKAQQNNQEETLSFFSFIKLHYADKHQNQKDHDNLPFKQHQQAPVMLSEELHFHAVQLSSANKILLETAPDFGPQIISNHTYSIWQPPRLG